MTLLNRTDDEATPERVTSLWLDVPQTVVVEPYWGFEREREQLARSRNLGEYLERNAAGGIQLIAKPEKTFWLHERVDGQASIIPAIELLSQAVLELLHRRLSAEGIQPDGRNHRSRS